MKIARLSVWHLALPLAAPYSLSGGRLKVEALDSTLVRVETDCGLEGWGEACPWGSNYLPAHGPGVRAALETLAPSVLGQDPRAPEAVGRAMDLVLPGHPYAQSAVDIACWDILGKVAGLPLWQLLGGEAEQRIALNSSIPTGDPEQMIARIELAMAAGYGVHSAKIGGEDPARDRARIAAIEAWLPTGQSVTYDVNRAWTPGVALQVLNSVEARGWVEQPCETLEECALVAAKVPQPILLDECLTSLDEHHRAWRHSQVAGLKVKPNRLGGLTKARQARDFSVAVGWQMHVEDVGGTVLADTAAIHLAAATPESHRLASWLAHAHLADDPFPGQGARNLGGWTAPPDLPGIGVVPDAASLGAPVAVHEGGRA